MSSSTKVNSIAFAIATIAASNAWADSSVIISIAGEAFDGPPKFELAIGGKVVGSGTLQNAIETDKDGRLFTKPRPSAFLEEFTFQVPDAVLLPDKEISILLTNDKFSERQGQGEDGIFDRNLFIDSIRVNGLELTSADIALTSDGEVQHLNYQAGLLPIYESGQIAVAKPPVEGWPEPGLGVSAVRMVAPQPAMPSWLLNAVEKTPR